MNYLAHLALAQPTSESVHGNLLGDFMKGSSIEQFSMPVQRGLQNHRFVDKYTDHHPEIHSVKNKFSAERRRFAAIIIDVSFDHYLIRHWSRFYEQSFAQFCEQRYALLEQALPYMPVTMQSTVNSLLKHRWLDVYATPQGLSGALDNTATRIRFKHRFSGSIEEVLKHYHVLEQTFLSFYPQLMRSVSEQKIESGHESGGSY